MRGRGVKSPDNLDAAVYASVDLSRLFEGPYAGKKPGAVVTFDPDNFDKEFAFYDNWVW